MHQEKTTVAVAIISAQNKEIADMKSRGRIASSLSVDEMKPVVEIPFSCPDILKS